MSSETGSLQDKLEMSNALRQAQQYLSVATLTAQNIHRLNRKFYRCIETDLPIERNHAELMMLMVSEIAEMMEGDRKNTPDKHLPHRSAEEVELADLFIRAYDYAGFRGMDLAGAIIEKLEYNAKRADHTPEERRKAHGKKY